MFYRLPKVDSLRAASWFVMYILSLVLMSVQAHAYVVPGTNDNPYDKPTNLVARASSSDPRQVIVTWIDPNNAYITYYKIYRDGVSIATSTTPTYTDTVTAGATYSYRVSACTNGNECSDKSSTVSITLAATNQAPVAPTGTTATADSASTATLNWLAATDDKAVTSYKIYNGATLVATVAGNLTSYAVTGLNPATTYNFIVVACDIEEACSAESTAASVTTAAVSTATVTGSVSSQTVTTSFVPAGNDQGKEGSVFVAALLPSTLGGGVYFMSSTSAWTLYTSCATAPAYSTGNLSEISSITIANSLDMTSLVGTQIYVGHGLGGALSPAGTACTNMLNNGSYQLTYTVQ